MAKRKRKSKPEPVLEIVIDTKDGEPVPADVAAKVLKNVVKLLNACETSMTGKPPKIEWLLTEVKTIDTTPE